MYLPVSRILSYALTTALLAGCATLPPLQDLQHTSEQNPRGPTLAKLVTYIQCELGLAYVAAQASDPDLKYQNYVAIVNLQVDAIATTGLSPSLSGIHPYHSNPSYSVTLAVSGQYSRANHENITYYFPVVFDGSDSSATSACAKSDNVDGGWKFWAPEKSMSEDIGFKDAIYTAVEARGTTLLSKNDDGDDPDLTKMFSQSNILGFTISMDFTVTSGAGVGPNWVLKHFKGPSGGGGGGGGSGGQQNLFSWNNVARDSMIISFMPATTSELSTIDREMKANDTKLAWAKATLAKAVANSAKNVNQSSLARVLKLPTLSTELESLRMSENLSEIKSRLDQRTDLSILAKQNLSEPIISAQSNLKAAQDAYTKAKKDNAEVNEPLEKQRAALVQKVKSSPDGVTAFKNAQDAIIREILLQSLYGR